MRCISDTEIARAAKLSHAESGRGRPLGADALPGSATANPAAPASRPPLDELFTLRYASASTAELRTLTTRGEDRPMPKPKTIAEALRRECNLRGISQNQAADTIGVTPQTFSKWVRGQMPGNDNLRDVAHFLKLSVTEVADLAQAEGIEARLTRIETQLERLEKLLRRLAD